MNFGKVLQVRRILINVVTYISNWKYIFLFQPICFIVDTFLEHLVIDFCLLHEGKFII